MKEILQLLCEKREVSVIKSRHAEDVLLNPADSHEIPGQLVAHDVSDELEPLSNGLAWCADLMIFVDGLL
ncbi:hypothetical protein D9M70_649730 [compost metagenome]